MKIIENNNIWGRMRIYGVEYIYISEAHPREGGKGGGVDTPIPY
jgi:hypothetical protein